MAYWDPTLPNTGGGTTQHLELTGYTLSLVPDGGSVQLPQNISTLGPTGYISTLGVLNEIDVGPTSNIRLLSTGDIFLSNAYGNLGNFTIVNANTTTTNSLTATNGTIQTINNRSLNNSTITTKQITTSSITIGDIRFMTIAQDTATPAATVTQTANQVFFKTNLGVTSPFVLAAATANLTDVNATTVEAATYLSSGTVYAGQVVLNGNQLSNNATNLTYNSNPIYTGQRGDASQWAAFPASGTINANNQALNNVGILNVNTTANLNTQHAGTISMLTNGANSDSGGSVNIGFDTGALSSTQPDLNANCRDVQIAAGAAVAPAYAAGRLIQMDAYPGVSYFGTPQTRQSAVRLTAHGTTGPYVPLITAPAAGLIELNAYNPTLTTDVFPPKGTIRLNGSYVTVGNDNSLPLIGASLQANVQALDVQVIAGSELLPGFGNPIPATLFRSGNGVEIQTNPLELTSNTDSKLYVKEVIGQSNTRQIFPDPFGPYLVLDGLTGGTTINNFKTANGQGAGAALNNIASMSGSYPNSVQTQIDALAASIANISTTGGTSNLAAWSAFPAISTVVANKNMYIAGINPSISTVGSLSLTDLSGNYGSLVVNSIGMGQAGNISSIVSTDVSTNFVFQNIVGGAPVYAKLVTGGVYMNNNLVTADASTIFINGSPLVIDVSGLTQQNLVSTVGGLGNAGYVSTATLNAAISSFSTALGFVGSSNVSSISQWSLYPVLSNSIQFGGQSVWLKGTTNALFTTSNGLDTIPVTAQKFVTFDANNVGVISEFQLDGDGVPMISKNAIPSWLRVSTLYLSSTTLSSDGSNLFVNGSNVTSSNVAGWASYPASQDVKVLNSFNVVVSTMTDSSVLSPGRLDLASYTANSQITMYSALGDQTIITNNNGGLFITLSGTNRFVEINGGGLSLGGNLFVPSFASTITKNIYLNSNSLTASNGNLIFNGSIVNASNSVNTWANFPAISDVDMNGNGLLNVSSITSINYTGSNGFILTPGSCRFNGVTAFVPPSPADFTSVTLRTAGVVTTTGLNGIFASPVNGYAYQNPTSSNWYKTFINSSNGILQINQMSNTSVTQTGLVYDTVFNPLPALTPIYLVPKGTIASTAYSGAGAFQVANGIASFPLPANQCLLTFKCRPATSMTGNGFAGIGPIGNYDYQSTIMASIGGYNSSTNAFATYSMYVNATAGTYYNFILNFPATGVVGLTEVSLKPLTS